MTWGRCRRCSTTGDVIKRVGVCVGCSAHLEREREERFARKAHAAAIAARQEGLPLAPNPYRSPFSQNGPSEASGEGGGTFTPADPSRAPRRGRSGRR